MRQNINRNAFDYGMVIWLWKICVYACMYVDVNGYIEL